jgi:hypothetical protein
VSAALAGRETVARLRLRRTDVEVGDGEKDVVEFEQNRPGFGIFNRGRRLQASL